MPTVNCPHCRFSVAHDASLATRPVTCPSCNRQFVMPQMKAPAPAEPAPVAPAAAPPAPRAPSPPAAAIDSPFQIDLSDESARGPAAAPPGGAGAPQRRTHRRKDNTPIIIAIGGAVAMVLLGIGAVIVLTLPDDKSKVESKVSPEERLVGKWSGKFEWDREILRGTGDERLTDEQLAEAEAMLKSMLASKKIEVDFRGDGAFDATMTGEPTIKGTWKVASSSGDTIKLDFDYTTSPENTLDFRDIQFTSKDRFVVEPSDDAEMKGVRMIFTRKK